jgi:monoterpene epsilon-lactone hydrolase
MWGFAEPGRSAHAAHIAPRGIRQRPVRDPNSNRQLESWVKMSQPQPGKASGIPLPNSISPEARRYLSGSPAYGDDKPPTDLTDIEAWLKYVESKDAVVAEALGAAMPAELPVERSESQINGVTIYVIRPTFVPDDADTPIYLDFHGGGLIMGGGELCKLMATGGALRRRMITWAVDYRMPPLHPYPAALDDCIATYRRALEHRAPEDIFVGGGSAGGNLAAALLLRTKNEGLPMPAALVLITPEVDLTESGDSFNTLLGLDPILSPLMQVNLLYANGHDLADPYLSPLFGDVAGFPPTFLQTGTRDLFLSNTVRMHRALRSAGVDAELHVFEAMPHGGFGGTTPEDQDLVTEVSHFLKQHGRT